MENGKLKIAIVGAGNVGIALAADLSLKGHVVTVVKSSSSTSHSDSFRMLEGNSSPILLRDKNMYHPTRINKCTTDVSSISDAEVVFVTTQTQYHEDVIKKIAPYLSKEQILVFVPSYLASMYVPMYVNGEAPTIVEMTGPPVEGRIEMHMVPGMCVFRVGSRLRKNRIAIIGDIASVHRKLSLIDYPFEHVYSPIESALNNPNLVLHTAGAVMSIPRIEKSKGEFCMYHEAYSQDNVSMFNIVEALNNEKNEVLAKFGYVGVPYLQAADFWGQTAMEKFLKYAESDNRAKGPTSVRSRYITEDVSQGLVLLESIAREVGVQTPLASALISIAGAALGVDYRKEGRTLSKLGAIEYIHSKTI